jgi:cytochrome c oxidase cbb3-type subunit III
MEENTKVDVQAEEHAEEHNYDGIQELDNPPPRWIMMMFYITIGFSIIYAAYFFWFDVGDLQDAQYAKKSQTHDIKYQMNSQSSDEILALTDPADIAEGAQIYIEMACMACHGVIGEGNAIGPNLTDSHSLNGCDFPAVFSIIKNGNPAKGMTAFKAQLSDNRIQKVSSYVMSMQGSNPPNAKGPQGQACE